MQEQGAGIPRSLFVFALLYGGLVVLAGVLAYLDTAGLGALLPPRYAWIPVALGALDVALRLVTTGPVGGGR